MKSFYAMIVVTTFVASVLAFGGCKARQEESQVATETVEMGDASFAPMTEGPAGIEVEKSTVVETIPPTAAPETQTKASGIKDISRDKEIQTALSRAGFYTGAIDGKTGPKTKKAIEEFQRSKALKADGKVGPKTWAELEKYLAQ